MSESFAQGLSDDRDQSQGLPGAQGSKTQTRWGGLKESSAKVAPWRAAVAYACEQQDGEPITDPVEMQITFLLPRAKHHWSKAKGKEDQLLPSAPLHCTSSSHGDIDKLARSTPGCARSAAGLPDRRRLTGGVAGTANATQSV